MSERRGLANPAVFTRMNRILMAAHGIDVNFSSGDNGDETLNLGFKTVDFSASSPYATGVGGTSLFLDGTGPVTETGWGTNLTRIADTAANGHDSFDPPQSSRS